MSWPLELRALIEANWAVGDEFVLADLYSLRDQLAEKYPTNRHITDSIRNTLVQLRREGWIELVEPGRYRRLR
jgi:hypothetical protein